MNLKEVTFGFENCEVLTIDGKNICSFLIDDLHTCFRRIACNAVEKVEEARTVAIEISKTADQSYAPFGQENTGGTKFKRLLAFDDITSIDFILCDNEKTEKYSYWVGWVGNNDTINEGQTTYLSELGNLYIVISESNEFEDFFNKDDINDKAMINIRFDLCDVE